MASHSSAKLSDVNLASAFSLMRHSMKKKVQEVVQQSAANLAELVMFLVLSHQNLNDPKYACELSEEILQRFDNWHNELLNSCFNFKRINYRHISDFKFNLATSKGSDKLFAKLDKLTDMMRSPAAISEIVEEPNRLKCFLLDVVKIIDAKVSLTDAPAEPTQSPLQLSRPDATTPIHTDASAKPLQPRSEPVQPQPPRTTIVDFEVKKLEEKRRYQTQSDYLQQDRSSTLYELNDDSRNYLTEKTQVNESRFTSEYARSRKSVNDPKKYGKAPLPRDQHTREPSNPPTQKRKSTTKVVVSTRHIEELHEENKENFVHHQSSGRNDKTPFVSKASSKPNSASNSYIGIESVSDFLGNYRAADPDPHRMLRLSDHSGEADSSMLNFSERKPKSQFEVRAIEDDHQPDERNLKSDQITALKFRDCFEASAAPRLTTSHLIASSSYDLFLEHQDHKAASNSIGAVPLQQFNTNQQSDCMTFHGTNNPDNFVSNTSEQNKILKNFLTFSNNAAVDYQSKTDLDLSQAVQPKKKASQKDLTGKNYKSESEQSINFAKKRGSETYQSGTEQQQLFTSNPTQAEKKAPTYSTNQDKPSPQHASQDLDRRSDHSPNIFKNSDARYPSIIQRTRETRKDHSRQSAQPAQQSHADHSDRP